jgi:hypothetical protein
VDKLPSFIQAARRYTIHGLFFKQIIEKSVTLEAYDVVLSLLPSAPQAKVNKAVKQLMSMLSLAIQALYGSKRGGLLGSKSNAKGGDQSLRAKKVFVSGAKEYVHILLQVVSLLDEPITWSKKHLNDKIQHKVQTFGTPAGSIVNDFTT